MLPSARRHAEKAKTIVGGIGTSRSWLGANASAALGAVLAGEGKLADAEHELTYAEHFLRDEIATVYHAWVLALLARVRGRRGRLDEAEASMREARRRSPNSRNARRIPTLADEFAVELATARARAESGELLEPADRGRAHSSAAAGHRPVDPADRRASLSRPNTIRTHIRALYRKLGGPPARTRSRARRRSACSARGITR